MNRVSTHLALAMGLMAGLAWSQAEDADRCVALMQAGDMPGFEACIEALQREILGGDPATAGELKQLDRAAEQRRTDEARDQAARDEQRAAYEARERARRCVDDQSTVGEARDGRRDYTFRYVNSCAGPVHLAFCVVDGPDRPSVRRRLTVPPGATEQFVLRLGRIAPIVVLDHCLDAAQCREAGPRDCAAGD